MSQRNLLEAVRDALGQALESDERVFLMGEDIGELGGAFGATRGLWERFGRRRVLDTPMCEWALVGAACGAALQGLRPVVEIQFADFLSTAFDPIVQYAATTHYRWGARIPIVIRAPWGGGTGAGPFHSQCPEAWFAHVAGLKVVIPSDPRDAKGLLLASIADPNPVLFLEPKYLYRRERSEVPEEPYTVPLGKAEVRRQGEHVTVATYGAMVLEALAAAEELAGEGVSLEVLDLRTVAPLDTESLLGSVRKTGRLLVLHEARRTGGVGAEVAARVAEEAFYSLDAPPVRIAAPDTPVPYSPPLEAAHRPTAERVARAARELARH